jgi:hypothetical protein
MDEYADHLTGIWTRVAEASDTLAADVTSTWWNARPIARPEGLNMAGAAAVLAARLSKLGPEGDPLEMLTMSLIAFAQSSRDDALAQVAHIEQQRKAMHDTSGKPRCPGYPARRGASCATR